LVVELPCAERVSADRIPTPRSRQMHLQPRFIPLMQQTGTDLPLVAPATSRRPGAESSLRPMARSEAHEARSPPLDFFSLQTLLQRTKLALWRTPGRPVAPLRSRVKCKHTVVYTNNESPRYRRLWRKLHQHGVSSYSSK
jgi:hypothetical protein